MKNIAVLVYDLTNDYSCTILEGITNYFKEKDDVHFVIIPANIPHATDTEYSYHYWTVTNLLCSKEIHSIIIVSNSFTNHITLECLVEHLKSISNKQVVSIAVPLEINNSKYTHTVCEEAYDHAVEHFVTKHGCKRFAFFSASRINSPESEERFLAFKNALNKRGISISEDDIFNGDFTPGTAAAEFKERVKSKDQLKYDAIFCANDYTLAGCIIACRQLGISIPDDVKLIGFDNCDFALITYPTMSSISQSLTTNGYVTADIAYRLANGEEVQKETIIQSKPIYRQSCGCVKAIHHSSAYVDENDVHHNIDEEYRDREINVIANATQSFSNIQDMLSIMDSRITFGRSNEKILTAMAKAEISSMIACFYDEPVQVMQDEDFEMPDSARVIIRADLQNSQIEINSPRKAEELNPKKRIVPKSFDEKAPGKYFIVPIYRQEENFGYLVCKTSNNNYPVVSIYLKILNNILIRAYEYTKEQQERQMLIEQKQKLSLESKTDELTHIFNRRGFMEYGQRLLSLSAAAGKHGMVFFCDLDGLKTINDTYGHDVGDAAILTEAQVLNAAFRNSDMIGRLSGDEFGVVAPGFTKNNIQQLRNRLSELNELYSKENELPFILSISVGPIEFNDENTSLEDLLKVADENLYEEKKIKHSKDKDYYKNRLIPNPDK